jgi:hypothetical protein
MKTASQLIEEVEAEPNAIRAVDMGLKAVLAFAQQAHDLLREGTPGLAEESITNLIQLVNALTSAVPANVTPASAGPVGKSPHEHYLEQAHDVVNDSLVKMQDSLKGVHDILQGVSAAVNHVMTATSALKSPDLKTALNLPGGVAVK